MRGLRKEDREKAKREKLPLIMIGYDETHMGGHELIYMGVGDAELVKEIRRLILDHIVKKDGAR